MVSSERSRKNTLWLIAEVLQAIGRSLRHISCTTIGKMKEYKRWGIYKQKMDITIFVWTNTNWARMFIAHWMLFRKTLADCGVMWFQVNSPSVFFNAGVLFKLCIFIKSSNKNYSVFVPPAEVFICLLFHGKLSFLKYTLSGFALNGINKHFVGLVVVEM